MNKTQMSEAMRELDYLALLEYRQPIAQLAREADPNTRLLRVGRLIGVMLKEPFSQPMELTMPSSVTAAYRGWEFDEKAIRSVSKRRTWQYKAIAELKNEYLGQTATVLDFVNDARYERGFFKYFAQSLHKYVCGDPKIRKKIESALKAGRKAGTPLPQLSPETIIAAGGSALGVMLVQQVPLLGIVGAPVIAAVVVIFYSVGIDAFCQWVQDSYETKSIEQ
jgi:hypothetical protein